MYTPPLLPILQYCPYCPLLYTVRTVHCYIYLLYGINRSLLFQPSTCHYLRASYTGDPDSTRMPPKMEPAAATDIDQRIATAVAAALAASRGAQAAAAPAAVNNVAVKLPEFWVADPDMWFMQAEAAFRTARINQSRTKFDHVLMRLPAAVSTALRSTITAAVNEAVENPYEQLRTKLLAIYGKTRWQRAFALLDHPDLGDRRPSALMSDMVALLPEDAQPNTLFLALFLRRLPPSLRDHLAAADLDTADEMAELADKLWDARNSQSISAVADSVAAVRPFSPSRSGRSPDRRPQQQQHHRQSTPHRGRDSSWCRNHRRFGDKTKNCTAPCSYSAEN